VESFKDQKFKGHVTKISPMGAEKDNVTTFEVRVSISNEKHILKAQMTANAEIILDEHKGVLAIPEGAVFYNKDKSTAAQIPDPTNEKGLRRVAIATGVSNGSKTEVTKGLTEGQQVILQ
jgi:HlyD family secretion protein